MTEASPPETPLRWSRAGPDADPARNRAVLKAVGQLLKQIMQTVAQARSAAISRSYKR